MSGNWNNNLGMRVSEYEKYSDDPNEELLPNGKLFRISYDSTIGKLKLTCSNNNEIDRIVNAYSDVNPTSFFMGQYGYNVPDRISVINKFGYFQIGFLTEILRYIKRLYGNFSVLALSDGCKRLISDYIVPLKNKVSEHGAYDVLNISEDSGRNETLIGEGKTPYILRDYQENSIYNLINVGFGKGMIKIPTAGGKSAIICNFCYNMIKQIDSNMKILILVPNKQLVYQMYNDFLDYGFDRRKITKLTAGLKKNEPYDKSASVIVANRQYVCSKKELLPKIDCIFCDEVHTVSPNSKTERFVEEYDCKMKCGCSGSIPKNKYNRWKLNGIFGDIVYSEDITSLQKRGYISKLKLYQISIVDTNVENNRNYLFHTNPLRKYCPDENGHSDIPFNAAHDAEHEYYEQYYKDLYKPALEYISKFDENTLILFDKIEFGKRLFELSKEIFKDRTISYIDGSVDVKDRLEITANMEKNGNNVLFAESATFKVGINVKRLTNLVFVSSSKSFPFLLQSIGRTLRLHDTKTNARIFDISFNFKYSQRHLIERKKIYKENYNKEFDEKVKFTI